ncbi:SDR family NAD(P)-dependent oxidoreductase [Kitasatospora sp. NBC_01287]|uniref:SDR family NAD(P)-dependent oxidoreductase n=1 Tax=Kitasatospora sp. NBC_01287 TaxID=2903573 RepID=UPI0022591D37|nr:SDR family NAD(P)-dependent oxidoreductase [Kitasatospora sp. NBC_01287]MCX4744650.1 SDR family NAD(P)-dependent oxidoreductase [Kitasatospora sp. NBC_01287]
MDALTPPTLRDRTVLITGATQGLGRGLALELARRGATLLLHGRDAARLDSVLADVREAGAPQARGYLADLADLDQVRALAVRLSAAEPRLDVLVNNAVAGGGTQPTVRETGAQGHELRLTVNHLAPHLLTQLLLPLLVRGRAEAGAAAARVVNIASIGQAAIDFTDPMLEQDYEGLEAYCRSKLALIMSTFDLAAALPAQQVTVNTLHPAHLMDTEGVRAYGLTPRVGVEEGVRPTVRLIADPELAGVTGRYFDQFTDTRAHEQAYDPEARARLAELTERLTAPFSAPIDRPRSR